MWECTATLPPVECILTELPLGCASPCRSTSTSAPCFLQGASHHQSCLTDTYCIGIPPSPKARNRHCEVKTRDTGLSVHAGASHELSSNGYIWGCMSRLRHVTLAAGRPGEVGSSPSCMSTTGVDAHDKEGDESSRRRCLVVSALHPPPSHPQPSPPCAPASSSR